MPIKKKPRIPETVINPEAAKWCLSRGYKIYPVPVDFKELKYNQKLGVKFKLVVEFGGEKRVGEKEYSQSEWSFAIWSVYNFLYNKHSDGEKA
jgi:hypothetical protein